MDYIESGHQETQQILPEPLQSSGLSGAGIWGLPATTLSAASLGVFLIVLIFLQRNAQLREFFRLDFWNLCPDSAVCSRIVIVVTALLAWTIVVRCRQRPGHWWPRYWALALALLASVVAVLLYLDGPLTRLPLLHALTAACFAATLTLTPRLLRFRPDSYWLQLIAPLSLLVVLPVILPSTCRMGDLQVDTIKNNLEQQITELNNQSNKLRRCIDSDSPCPAAETVLGSLSDLMNNQTVWENADNLPEIKDKLRKAAGKSLDVVNKTLSDNYSRRLQQIIDYDWAKISENPASAEKRIRNLSQLKFNDLLPKWIRLNGQLDQKESFGQAYRNLLDSVGVGFDPKRAPLLAEAPVAYSPEPKDGPWSVNPNFSKTSGLIVDYYQQFNRIFKELDPQSTDGNTMAAAGSLASLQSYYEQKKRDWPTRLQGMKESWAESWLFPVLMQEPSDSSWLSLDQILKAPVIDDLAAANLAKLLDLSKGNAEKLLGEKPSNCRWFSRKEEDKKQGKYISRLECRSYAPDPTAGSAVLRVELRLIYESSRGSPTDAAKPTRLYFIFPIPPDENEENFKRQVSNALQEARRQLVDDKGQLNIGNPEVNPFVEGTSKKYVSLTVTR